MVKQIFYSTLVLSIFAITSVQAANMRINPEAQSFRYSTTVEKERPLLDDVTRGLISAYQKIRQMPINRL